MFLKRAKGKKRDVIVHAHIFKNAGTTIDWILQRNFGRCFIDDRNDQKMRSEADYLSRTLLRKKTVRAIASHSVPLPIADIPGIRLHSLVMLRHPLLRVRSVYDFEHKQDAETPGAIQAKKYNFADYVAWRMQADVAPTIRNMQTRYLTRNSLPHKERMTSDYLDQAVAFVADNPLVGVVEQFDHSMVVFKDQLSSNFPDLDFSYRKQNVTEKKKLSPDEKLAQLETDLGKDLFDQLQENNHLDMALHDAVSAVVKQRFQAVEQPAEKLAELRSQCAGHRSD